MTPSVTNTVDEYFYSLNPLARRIWEDINHTREAYEALWQSLSDPEQRQILDEAIIRPEAVLKYSRRDTKDAPGQPAVLIESFPRFRLHTGAKYVVYEDGTMGKGIRWRDEHSAPFSWLTRSQQDLRLFTSSDPLPTPSKKLLSKSSTPIRRSKPPAPPVPSFEEHMDPPSLVLGGSSAKLISSVSSPGKQPSNGLLNKLISKTSGFKLPFSSKSVSASDSCDKAETESLLNGSCEAQQPRIIKPAVLKPKSPPPPPPPSRSSAVEKPLVKPTVKHVPKPVAKPVIKPVTKPLMLPPKNYEKEEGSGKEEEAAEEVLAKPVAHFSPPKNAPTVPPKPLSPLKKTELNDDAALMIPKTGFEFLDNW